MAVDISSICWHKQRLWFRQGKSAFYEQGNNSTGGYKQGNSVCGYKQVNSAG